MYKKTMIASGIAMAMAALPVMADGHGEEGSFMDEWEISGELKNETAVFTQSGQGIGAKATYDQTTDTHGKDVYKSESTAKVFVNGDVGESGSSFHAELNLRYDAEGIDGYKGAKSYSQHDLLRELYVDTETGSDEENPISLRVGKQQVVWGTADGMKLLDIINPTDWREFAQNTMEDSRIPVWMVNAEKDVESGGNIQLVLSQAEENKIAGLSVTSSKGTAHTNGDHGHPFKMKGVDTITGKVDGFLNAAPMLGKVAKNSFGGDFSSGTPVLGGTTYRGYNQTVYDYVNNNSLIFNQGGISPTSWTGLCGAAHSQDTVTNLCVTDGANFTNPGSVFEYMPAATFATFDTMGSMTTEYRVEEASGVNTGLRFKNSTDAGVNYSVNYFRGSDSNPHIDLHWEDPNGNRLYVGTTTNAQNKQGDNTTADETVTTAGDDVVTVHLHTTAAAAAVTTNTYDTVNSAATTYEGGSSAPANLVFTERYNDIQGFGGAFDVAVDTESLGAVVVRGEMLYKKDVKSPIVDRQKLSYGDLAGALTMVEGDYFNYVLGADVTVMTNLMLSGQFIQERNLDFVDESRTCASQVSHCGRYTGDRASMHMSNGLQKAEKNKEFYSFFMSKPFGAEQQHRWNNIFMFEENGGKWNRFDVEYSFNDELIGTAEYNKYWGDENTQFGQLEKSSNFQLGLKYLF